METVHSINNLSDKEILTQYRDNPDVRLVGVLFNRYKHLVFGVCMKYLKNTDEAEDATMNVFEQLINQLKQYEIAEFRFWLHTVTKNYCLYVLRKSQARYKHEQQFNKDMLPVMETDEQMALLNGNWKNSKLSEMETALIQLKDEQRICVQLFYLQSKSYKEIVDATGYSMNDVKSFIQNGKRNLKIILSKNDE